MENVPAEEIEKNEFTRVNSFFFCVCTKGDKGDGSVWLDFDVTPKSWTPTKG